jgi:hypothetical protein
MVPADPGRAAVLAPGGGYSTDGPLLMYAGLAVERRGGYATSGDRGRSAGPHLFPIAVRG